METTTEVELSPELRKKLDAAVRNHPPPRRFWNAAEDAILRKYYKRMAPKHLREFLPGRSVHALHCRAIILGLGESQ